MPYADWTLPVSIIAQDAAVSVDLEFQTLNSATVTIAGHTGAVPQVNIVAQSLANVKVDLNAQSLANITVNLAAQSLANVKVDLNAQSLANITVNLAAQSLANVKVDLNAQSLANITVNLAAQSLANVLVSFNAQTRSVSDRNQYQTEQGNNFSMTGLASIGPGGTSTLATRTAAAGKKLYITHVSFSGNDFGNCRVTDGVPATVWQQQVNLNHAVEAYLDPPLVSTTAGTLDLRVNNPSGASTIDVQANAVGYEV